MADVSDPAIRTAYADVRDDGTETNWLLVSYESDTSDKLKLHATGTDGLEGFKAAVSQITAGYGYVRFAIGNDELSRRSKFVFVSWTGPGIKVMRKARLSVHIADVKKVIKDFAVQVAADNVSELQEEEITLLLKKAMGANYDRQSSAY